MRKRLSLKVFTLIWVVALMGAMLSSRISVTSTDSLGYRVFWLSRSQRAVDDVKKGDYVLFELRSKHIDSGRPVNVIKQIACVGGDVLAVIDRKYYCNGEYLGRAKEFSRKGEPLRNFVYKGEIPAGSFFVVGRSKDSFDSRYWGFLKKEKINAIAYPLF